MVFAAWLGWSAAVIIGWKLFEDHQMKRAVLKATQAAPKGRKRDTTQP